MRANAILAWVALGVRSVANAIPVEPVAGAAPLAAGADSYDYVVVGSGPGGAPLAARLAIAGHKVLLLEAGGDAGDSPQYQVPALNLLATELDTMRWDYYVTHHDNVTEQKLDSKMTYRTAQNELYTGLSPPGDASPLGVLYPRAGTLGGCAAHNALITVYPHRSDWALIQDVTGDVSWHPDAMRRYFQRLERAEYLPNGIVGHGFSGWLTTTVTDLRLVLPDVKLLTVIVSAAAAMGKTVLGSIIASLGALTQLLALDINADFPGRDALEGLYQVPITVDSGVRRGPREFVLETAGAVYANGSRKYHLDIWLNTLVTKVRFNTTSGTVPKAVGVDFLRGDSLYRADPRATPDAAGSVGSVDATKEVILSAGAFNTPQLLKLSGVGPAAELAAHSIPLVFDLPGVGTNLQDRYETSVIGQTTPEFVVTRDCTFLRPSPDADPCYTKWKGGAGNADRGIYASNGLSVGIVKKSASAGPQDDPDLFIAGAPAYFPGYYPGYAANATAGGARHWSWVTLKAHARGRAGTVKLRSADPRDPPLIDFNSFGGGEDGQRDVAAVAEGMRLSRKMFRDVLPLAGGFSEVWPGSGVADADLEEFVRREAWGHHASCTCPIGAEADPMAVLDSKFRVRGTTGLRIVDASVFPRIPGFYVAVPVYMASEKAADDVLADAGSWS